MFPIMAIVIGITVLVLGKRLAVLGAAVGALLGIGLLSIIPGSSDSALIMLGVPIGLALLGFFAAGFAKGIIEVVILVLGALAGAAIVLGFLNLFRIDLGLMNWLLAVVGGVAGLMLIRSSRKASKDWGLIILAGLVGSLLVTRGLTVLIPSMQDTLISTIVVIVLAGGSIAYQGGLLNRGSSDADTTA